MEAQVWALKRGEPIEQPIYDHSDGTLTGPERVEPREIVIMQGLHPFAARSSPLWRVRFLATIPLLLVAEE
jgi:uridine kinase